MKASHRLPVKRLRILAITRMPVLDDAGNIVEDVPVIEVRGRTLMRAADFIRVGLASRSTLHRWIRDGRLRLYTANGAIKPETARSGSYVCIREWIGADLSETDSPKKIRRPGGERSRDA